MNKDESLEVTSLCHESGVTLDVLHIGISFYPYLGGSSIRLGNLLKHQNRVRSHVVTHTPGETTSGHGANTIIRLSSLYTLASIRKLRRIVQVIRPHVVVLHNNRALLLWTLLIDPLRRIPTVVEIHSFRDLTRTRQRLTGLLLRRANAVVVLAKCAIAYTEKTYKLPEGRVQAIRNGVPKGAKRETDDFAVDARKIVLFLGTFYEWQGVNIIAEAASLLPASFYQKARIVIAGGGPEAGRLQERLAALVQDGRVALPGWVSTEEGEHLMARSSIVLMPRISTIATEYVLPLKVFEAMRHAKAIIASRVGGLMEVLEENRTAVFVTPGDANDLAAQIARLVDDPLLCDRLGEAAATASNLYPSWNDSAGAYESLFRRIALTRTR